MDCAIKDRFVPILRSQNQFFRTILGITLCVSLFLVVGCGGDTKTKSSGKSKSAEPSDTPADTNAEPAENPPQETFTQNNTNPDPSAGTSLDPPAGDSSKLNGTDEKDPATQNTGDRPKDPEENPFAGNRHKSKLNKTLILMGIKRERPKNISKWELTDIRPAIEEKSPLLPFAIRYFEKKYKGNPDIVEILMGFLNPKTLNPELNVPHNKNNRNPQPGNTQPIQLDDKTVERIIVALARNRTPEAARALRKIVTDKNLDIYQPATATKAALQVLAVMDIDCDKNDNVLFTALVDPREYRDLQGDGSSGNRNYSSWGGGQRLSAEQFAQEAEQLLKPIASENVRTRLAVHVLPDSSISRSEREKFLAWFKESAPENVMGQLRIYEENVPNPELLDQFEKYFSLYSGTAIGRLLGVLPSTPNLSVFSDNKNQRPNLQELRGWGGSGNSGSTNNDNELAIYVAEQFEEKARKKSPEEELVHLAQKLWSDEIAAILISRLNERLVQNPLEDYKNKEQETQKIDEKNRVALACTIPMDKVRHTLFKRCKNHYQQGPEIALADIFPKSTDPKSMDPATMKASGDNANSGGTSSDVRLIAIDPGLLVTLKMLHREDPNIAVRNNPRGRMEMPAGGGGGESVQNKWFYASQQLVTKILDQCYKACSTSPATGGMKTPASKPKAEGEKAEADPSSIELHRNATVVSRLDFKLPQSVQGPLGKLPMDPLEVHYIRIEETNLPKNVCNHYKRIVKGQIHPLIDSSGQKYLGFWFDGIQDGNAKGTKRSVDVLVTEGRPKVAANPDGKRRRPQPGMPIVVQILVVETANPTIAK